MNTVVTESISTRLVLLKTLIDLDTTQNDMLTTFEDLRSKCHGSEGGEGRKGGDRRSKTEKVLRGETIVTLN